MLRTIDNNMADIKDFLNWLLLPRNCEQMARTAKAMVAICKQLYQHHYHAL